MGQPKDLRETITTALSPATRFIELSSSEQQTVFFGLSEAVQASIIGEMPQTELTEFTKRLDPDEATDVLRHADKETRTAVLAALGQRRHEKIRFLLSFDAETAAGLMTLDYITVEETRTIADVVDRVRQFNDRTGREPTVFVTADGRLRGELPTTALSTADHETAPIAEYVQQAPQVRYDREDEAVVDVFTQNRERVVAVLDEADEILGVIRAEDLLEVLAAADSETLYEFTGVPEEGSIVDGPGTKVRRRYKWLIFNLGTAFLAAAVVGLFEATIATVAILAAYMPVVAGMGGNAGTQAMAVTVRGISLNQVSLSTGRQVILNEVVAGAINGLITGGLVAAIATAFSFGEFGITLGAVIGLSMVANLVIAGFFGAITPLVLDRGGYDPATSATIFITTATDVLGFLFFLGLAQTVLL